MDKVRITEIAKELGMKSKDVIEKAVDLGLDVKSASSSIATDDAEKLMNLRSIPFSSDDQNLESMWRENGWEDEYASRCEMCYDLRIMRTAMEAKARGIPYFSTTLLVSIYQNHDAIVRAGEKAAKQTGTSFLYRDFRDGFRKGQEMAKNDGLYRQKYCGCILSLDESAYKEKIYQSFSGRSGDTRSV